MDASNLHDVEKPDSGYMQTEFDGPDYSDVEAFADGGGAQEAYVPNGASGGIGEELNEKEHLTEKQIAARKRLKAKVAAIKASAEARNPEVADGPPWKYDLTPQERARRQEKRAKREQRTTSIKNKALDKTPSRLKNPTDLQIRFRTAVVYTLLTIACVFGGNYAFLLYLMVVAGICAGEFFYMLRSDAKLPNEALGIAGSVLYLPAVYFWGLTGGLVVSLALLLALLVWYVFWLRARVQDVGVSFFGAAYTGLLLCGLVIVRQSVDGLWGSLVLFILFLSVWGNDAFAYFFGSRFGKHKLAPRTSPKKSWEGFFAGLVASILGWVVISFIPGIYMSVAQAIIFGIICGCAEVIGDLAESRIKRNSGFKDSGTIMPGHGGLLDRCDSLFLASAVSAILLVCFGCVPYVF